MHSISWTFAFLYLKWCNWVIDPLSLCMMLRSFIDVDILLFPLLIWSSSMFWCSIKTVCYRSLAVIYFRRSKSNVRHIDFWSSYLVCMHLNDMILGYFYSAHFSKNYFWLISDVSAFSENLHAKRWAMLSLYLILKTRFTFCLQIKYTEMDNTFILLKRDKQLF